MRRRLVPVLAALVAMGCVPATDAAETAAASDARKVEVACVYYPHWHRYPKGDEWFGADNWKEGEWTFVKTAKPRFPGHNQPMVPYPGYLNGADPKDVETEIALAANAGIDVFLYDYYFYNGQVTQEEALEQGFMKARNRDRLKFALMWCYHERRDQFRPEHGVPRRILMELAHTPEEFYAFIDLCIARYFRHPQYWKKDGRLFLSIFAGQYFIDTHGGVAKVKEMLAEARRRVRAAGLGDLHLNVQQLSPARAHEADACGFDSLTTYGYCPWHMPDWKARVAKGEWLFDYAETRETLPRYWRAMDAATKLPYFPIVSTGWDSTPRCRPDEPFPWRAPDYPYTASFTNNTPDLFRANLADAKRFAETNPKHPGVVYINGWNEYTEGTYLLPNNLDADLHLRAIAATFGRKPADEYTYVNPSTKTRHTVPAATFENVAYGPHAKQKVDVWRPQGDGPFPAVVYIHGGGWDGGAMVDAILGASLKRLLDRGVAVAAIGYRYLRDVARDGGAQPPVQGCLDDAEAAVKFLQANAGRFRLDTARLALAGGSAGACTALYLGLKDGNALNIAAVAPIIAQTSLDPKEMQAWIPDITYGAHAFGYRTFADWLAHRADGLVDIERISPAALARRIDPARAPRVFLQYGRPVPPGERAKDPTHSPVFGERFKEICTARGIACDIGYGGRPSFGDAFDRLADFLLLH